MEYNANTPEGINIQNCLPEHHHLYAYHHEAKGYAFVLNGDSSKWHFISYDDVREGKKLTRKEINFF